MDKLNSLSAKDAPAFNIKAVVTQTGLKSATIRAWERRYGLPSPDRTSGGHRQYSQRDIDTLLWLVARQQEGVSISHAVEFWQAYIERGEDPLQISTTVFQKPISEVAQVFKGGQIDKLRETWIAACLAFNREMAEQALAAAFALFKPETVCIEVLQRGLAEIGNQWYEGQVSVQQEHFTSSLSLQRLEMLIAAAPPPARSERIIVAAAPGDFHIFSSLLLTFLLRQQGWDVIYLGADVPGEELDTMISQVQPELFIVTAQLLQSAATLKDIALLAQSQGTPVAYGGLIFNQTPKLRQLIPAHFLGESIESAISRIPQLLQHPSPDFHPDEEDETYQRALVQFRERRDLIESQVWGTFIATNKPTNHLSSINHGMAQTIEAALKLGDLAVLVRDISWIEYLLVGYRLPKDLIVDYVLAYYQATKIHLGESASIVVDWLTSLLIQDKGKSS